VYNGPMLGAKRPGRAIFPSVLTLALAAAACGGSATTEPPGASGAGGAIGVGGAAGAAGAGGSGGTGGAGAVVDASNAGGAFAGVTDAANDSNDAEVADAAPNDAGAAADVANDAQPPVDALAEAAADVREAWPPGAGVADILYGHTFTYWVLRKWIRATPSSLPPSDSEMVSIVPEPHFTVRFSADGASITLAPVADAAVPSTSALSGTRTETTVITATYLITTATGGNFVAWINAFPAAAAVTIYGSGLPVIYATRGELRE
jgi:hypothetical protein